MANTEISALDPLAGGALDDADLLVVVDVSDTTMAPSGTDKSLTVGGLKTALDTRYATDADVATEATARAAADTAAIATAEGYTDSHVATEATARVAGDAAAVTTSEAYTDTKVGTEATARAAADAATLATAEAYTDAAVIGSSAAEFVRDTIGAALVAGARIAVTVNDPGDTITIAVTGLSSADLSDFGEAVQDQIGTHVIAGTMITSTYDDPGTGSTTIAVDTAAFDERARDTIGAALVAGARIAITVNDPADTITIAVTGLTSTDLSDFTEAVQDVVGAFVVGGTGITATYSDVGNMLTFAIDTAAENERIDDRVAALLIAGANIALTYDDPGNALTIAVNRPLGLTPAAVKTANYNANAGELVPCNTTGGGFTVTLPNAPADGAVVAIKHVIQGSTNVVTIACAGADVFNKTGGATSATLPLLAQALLVQYKASGAIWYVISDDLPLSQLDARYAITSNDASVSISGRDLSVAGTSAALYIERQLFK